MVCFSSALKAEEKAGTAPALLLEAAFLYLKDMQ